MLLEIVTLPWTTKSPKEVPASRETPTTSVSKDVTTTDRTTATETVTLFSGISLKETEELTTTTDRPNSSSHSPAEMKLHEKKIPEPETMPSGVAAVIAAVSFAIIVVVTYIGLLVRKRCVEYVLFLFSPFFPLLFVKFFSLVVFSLSPYSWTIILLDCYIILFAQIIADGDTEIAKYSSTILTPPTWPISR